ncbi:MAG: type II and III secretion system protein family protein [Nitrospirae bacterium]|nr:MAG: type II and III secretion system protein family protein [Nitrospirota bacterium]
MGWRLFSRTYTALVPITFQVGLVTILLFLGLCPGIPAFGQEVPIPSSETPSLIEVELGKSKLLDSPVQIRRASVANPQIADALVLSPTQLYLVGNQTGETNLTLWDQNGAVLAIYDLRVVRGVTWLKEQLYTLLGEKDIQVTATQDYIALSGTVSSATNLAHALALAETFAPKKVLNLLQVGGQHQVMLEVRIAEMSRSLIRRLGINFKIVNGNDFGITQLNNLTTNRLSTGTVNTTLSSFINALVRIQSGSLDWTTFIDALKTNGLVKILAEPNLVTISGQEATFLAGGEVPILVAQALGANSIQFKQFGVAVTFKPTVLSPNKISMEVTPEFSEIDESRETVLGVPAFLTRRVSTVIELADGQSFAIGGLIQDNVREQIRKYPLLGDIPILGALFRSSEFQKNETELIIIVTPRLVKPLDMASQSLPTSTFIEPDDLSFYLGGFPEQPPPGHLFDVGLDGAFGYIHPNSGGLSP